MIRFAQAFALQRDNICAAGRTLCIAAGQRVQLYDFGDGRVVPRELVEFPHVARFIEVHDSHLFAMCGDELYEADLAMQNPAVMFTGISVRGIRALAAANDLVALAGAQKISVYNIETGKLMFETETSAEIVKIIAYGAKFAFITQGALCQLDLASKSVTEHRPHEQANIREKTQNQEFRYVDVFYDDKESSFYLINEDGKTILMNAEFSTQRWQNITEQRYKAVGAFAVGDKQIIYFDHDVIKINQSRILSYLGRVQYAQVKELAYMRQDVVFACGYGAEIAVVFSCGGIALIKPEFAEVQCKMKLSGCVCADRIIGKRELLAADCIHRVVRANQQLFIESEHETQAFSFSGGIAPAVVVSGVLIGVCEIEPGSTTDDAEKTPPTHSVGLIFCALADQEKAKILPLTGVSGAIAFIAAAKTVNPQNSSQGANSTAPEPADFVVALATRAGVVSRVVEGADRLQTRSYDIKTEIESMQLLSNEVCALVLKQKAVLLNLVTGQRDAVCELCADERFFACTYNPHFGILLLGVQSEADGSEIRVYGRLGRVLISRFQTGAPGDDVCAGQALYLSGNAIETAQLPLVVAGALRCFNVITGRMTCNIEVVARGTAPRVYTCSGGRLGVLCDASCALIDSIPEPSVAELNDAEIQAYGRTESGTEVLFNDTEFDADAPVPAEVQQPADAVFENPFQRPDELNGKNALPPRVQSRPGSAKNQADSFSASDVSELVMAAVEKSKHGAESRYHDKYIYFDDDELIQPIFGYELDAEPQICTKSEASTNHERPVLQSLLESSSEELSDRTRNRARSEAAAIGKTPAEQLLKLVKTGQMRTENGERNQSPPRSLDAVPEISLLQSPDSENYTINVEAKQPLNTQETSNSAKPDAETKQNEESQLGLQDKNAPPEQRNSRPRLEGEIKQNAHEDSVPTQSETQAREEQVVSAAPKSKLRGSQHETPIDDSETGEATQNASFGTENASTICCLAETVSTVQKLLAQTLNTAEQQPEEAMQAEKKNKAVLQLQLRLLRNTIDRINVLYGFEDELATKVDELTRIMGRTLNSEPVNMRPPPTPNNAGVDGQEGQTSQSGEVPRFEHYI